MNAGFVDPGGWMACADRSDPAHVACTAARDATLEAGRLLITTDFVVDETLTLIRFRLGLAAANAWWEQIDGSARLRWERVENDRFERARHLFFQYRDKDLSFTDCTSFAIMRELKLTNRDHHRWPLSPGRVRRATRDAASKNTQATALLMIHQTHVS
jgi:predicted nucleic acid-binding protein